MFPCPPVDDQRYHEVYKSICPKNSSGLIALRVTLRMSTRNRDLAERIWARLRPQFVEMLAEMLDTPPEQESPPGDDAVTENDMERIRRAVSAKRARTAQRGQ